MPWQIPTPMSAAIGGALARGLSVICGASRLVMAAETARHYTVDRLDSAVGLVIQIGFAGYP